MTQSLTTLCDALKHILTLLKPRTQPISFLILTSRDNQGKSTLMRQSSFDHHPIDAEGAHIYSNAQGVIVELGETWLNQDEHRLEQTVKQLNNVHKFVKINGILLCVDINELLLAKHGEIKPLIKAHAKLLERFGLCLNYPLHTSVVLTKLDLVPGFCDFYQSEHPLDLAKPLGFSIYDPSHPQKSVEQFKSKFDQMVHQLGQQVTQKIHPIRSHVQRTLIREFPLQIASLHNLILPLIGSISSKLFCLQAVYFTSGEQGGVIQDRLNKKIQHEFALVIQDKFHQSTHYRAYFIEGALFSFQAGTQRHAPKTNPKHLRMTLGLSAGCLLAVIWITYQYIASVHLLNHVDHELHMVHALNHHDQSDAAIYHLSKASTALASLSSQSSALTNIQTLQNKLKKNTIQKLNNNFIPEMLHELESSIVDSSSAQVACYQALKIYLMLGDHHHYQSTDVIAWFTQHWQSDPNSRKKLTLLKQVLADTSKPIVINQNIVSDARNYLNALPPAYLYYALAKTHFDSKTVPVQINGFHLGSAVIPVYVTQTGFQQTLSLLPNIIKQLTLENWILEHQNINTIGPIIQSAYCSDYASWWQHFLSTTQPIHIENYEEAHKITKMLRQSNSLAQLIQLIQTHTRPHSGPNAELFNHEIANTFSDLNLLNPSSLTHVNTTLNELEQFSRTLALVPDNGKTAFYLVKARFDGDTLANPISTLYKEALQFPDPVSTWITQLANETWSTLIHNSRTYINQAWQDLVFHEYEQHIAHRYPLDTKQSEEISLNDFNQFFATHGKLNQFFETYIKPFLDTHQAQWQRKELNHYVLPISDDTINELIRANVITHMFFPNHQENSQIQFSLQKISLDPVVSKLQLTLGHTLLSDDQNSDNSTDFNWPQSNARLILRSIEGKQLEIDETGPWALFKLLQKVNVLVDEQDSANLQILFEINGNSGRYLLKAQNQVNPFIPGILNEFTLSDHIV